MDENYWNLSFYVEFVQFIVGEHPTIVSLSFVYFRVCSSRVDLHPYVYSELCYDCACALDPVGN